jgi:serine/threonine protein kinase
MLTRYEIESKVASGKFAKVYKAYDKQDKRQVAIKCMKKQRVNDTKKDIDISKERVIHKKLTHPNIPQLFESLEEYCECEERCPHLIYIVMEYVDGKDIYEVLIAEKIDQLPERRAAKYIREIIDALGTIGSAQTRASLCCANIACR